MTTIEVVLAMYSSGITLAAAYFLLRRPKTGAQFSIEEQSVIAHTLTNGVSSRSSLINHTPHSANAIDIAVASLIAQEILTVTVAGGVRAFAVSDGSEICALRE